MKKLGIYLLLWLLLIQVAVRAAIKLPYLPSFPYADNRLINYGDRTLTTFAQFDGVHYLTLIEKGYRGTALIQAFFPVYPMVTSWLTFGKFNAVIVGVIFSVICFGMGVWFLFKLLTIDYESKIAWKTILLILLFPVSFFFSAVYTEGLFFCLSVSCLLAARKKFWILSALLGALMTGTRLIGIFIIPALLLEWWSQNQHVEKRSYVNLGLCVFPVIGLIGYMWYLRQEFNDPIMFFHAQQNFGTGRETGKIILLYQVIYRYIKMFVTVPVMSRVYYVVIQEFIFTMLALLSLVVGWFRIRRSYVIYAASAIILPTLTGTLTSMPRYILPLFPVFLVAALKLPEKIYVLLLVAFGILLVINITMFTQGLWVA